MACGEEWALSMQVHDIRASCSSIRKHTSLMRQCLVKGMQNK